MSHQGFSWAGLSEGSSVSLCVTMLEKTKRVRRGNKRITNLPRCNKSRKGGLPPLTADLLLTQRSGGKPPFLTCYIWPGSRVSADPFQLAEVRLLTPFFVAKRKGRE